jgi:4-hydroxy-tetrahydrodipicolinate reductase
MIRTVVTGAAGRMGKQIVTLVNETEGLTLVGAAEHIESPAVGQDAGEVAGIGRLGVNISLELAGALAEAKGTDVIIDFTSAAASMEHLKIASEKGVGIIIASTGFSDVEKSAIRATTATRVFFAPNMSVGMNVLFKLVHDAATMLGDDFDVEIVETHHRFKKDSPSGSAVWLADSAAKALGRDMADDGVGVYGREGLVGERTRREIGVHAIRAGDVVGDHTVIFGGLGERVEMTHKATSRETFARGAIRAALWLPTQKPGVHDMMELLGLS